MAHLWSTEASRLPPGTRLNGIFEIDRCIAAGSTGDIYRGHVVETAEPVAIKVIRSDLVENILALAQFRKEIAALHCLEHDAIVRYYMFSTDPVVRRHYLAMEFVDGRPLEELLHEGPLTFDAVRPLLQRIAAGLHAAHQHGIVHRDVSSDNILIPNGDVSRAKLIDFGMASSTRLGADAIMGSCVAGKCRYVSPEQLGLYGGNVTPKSDIYSLGLVLVHCFSGRAIDMGGDELEVVDKRRTLPNLGAVDPRYRPLFECMLQPDPNDRPESMAAVAAWRPDAADGARPAPSRGEGQNAIRTASLERRPRSSAGRISKALALTTLVLVLLVGAGSAAFYLLSPLMPQVVAQFSALGLAPAAPPAPARPSLSQQYSPNLAKPPGPNTAPPLSIPALMPPTALPHAIPPSPRPARQPTEAAERLSGYLSSYSSDDCLLAIPTSLDGGRASIDVYSAAPGETQRFEADLRRGGFDPAINALRVTREQCPAVSFVSRLRGAAGAEGAPRLELASSQVRSGTAVTGMVEGASERPVELLLIADDGLVYTITNRLAGAGDSRSFSIVLKLLETGSARPQLVLAVAGSRAIAALKPAPSAGPSLGVADLLFPRVFEEVQRAGQSLNASLKLFQLEN
jgi:serine/threonine protein kinase